MRVKRADKRYEKHMKISLIGIRKYEKVNENRLTNKWCFSATDIFNYHILYP